jgi:flagellar operon protein
MLSSDYIKLRALESAEIQRKNEQQTKFKSRDADVAAKTEQSFSQTLKKEIESRVSALNTADTSKTKSVQFSAHALKRIESRSINLDENGLQRLNEGVEIAAKKGGENALVIIDSAAFVVNVRNNKVITALSGGDLHGAAFTNIDSTVIM